MKVLTSKIVDYLISFKLAVLLKKININLKSDWVYVLTLNNVRAKFIKKYPNYDIINFLKLTTFYNGDLDYYTVFKRTIGVSNSNCTLGYRFNMPFKDDVKKWFLQKIESDLFLKKEYLKIQERKLDKEEIVIYFITNFKEYFNGI